MQPGSSKKNMIIIEGTVVIILLLGGFLSYKLFFADQTATKTVASNNQLGKNIAVYLQVLGKGEVNLDIDAIKENAYVKTLQDNTQTFNDSTRRGRFDPFLPYDFTRPIR